MGMGIDLLFVCKEKEKEKEKENSDMGIIHKLSCGEQVY